MTKRTRRKHRRYRYTKMRQRARSGWDMNLYRNVREKKIAGVCAGIADHFDVAHWFIRIAFVCALLFTGTLAVFAYIAGWCLMAPQRPDYEEEVEETVEYDARRHEYKPRKMFKYSEGVDTRMQRAKERLDAAVSRVEEMESYVTSRQYELNKEFAKISD
jgi:phage shock protein C